MNTFYVDTDRQNSIQEVTNDDKPMKQRKLDYFTGAYKRTKSKSTTRRSECSGKGTVGQIFRLEGKAREDDSDNRPMSSHEKGIKNNTMSHRKVPRVENQKDALEHTKIA